jgi:hypothetical protein
LVLKLILFHRVARPNCTYGRVIMGVIIKEGETMMESREFCLFTVSLIGHNPLLYKIKWF